MRRMEMNEHTEFFPEGESEWTPMAATFTHPDDVVNDPRLTRAEKKAVLASWVSDARTVESAPKLRRLDSGAVVEVETILRAMRSLEARVAGPERRPKWLPFAPYRRGVISSLLRRGGSPARSDDDDDDDPPTAPAALAFPFRPIFVEAHGARLAACAAG